MAIKVAAWNVLDSFSKESMIEPTVRQIDRMDADVMVLPEAYKTGQERLLDGVDARLKELGYVATRVAYDDDDDRTDQHGLIVINRLNEAPARAVRMATRTALRTEAEGIGILGVHLDDHGEARRLDQAEAAIANSPRIMLGDMNSVSRRHALARATTLLPAHYPTPERPNIAGWERISNIAHRVGAMASSHVHERLVDAGYTDANGNGEPTWPSRRPMLDLDQIWWLGGYVQPEINVRDFEVHERVRPFDHLPVSAVIESGV